MPTVEEDLAEGLRISIRDGERIEATRKFMAYDLAGGTGIERLAKAFDLGELPSPSDGITIRIPGTNTGRVIYPNSYDATPWGDADAEIFVGYAEKNLSIATGGTFGRATVSGGTSLRQIETEFDYTELQKPFLQRTPISVSYDAASDGAPDEETSETQGGRVPMFLPESSVTFTRFERTYPGPRSRQYAGKRNASEYEACPAGTLLMWSVTFDQIGSGLWSTSYTMVFDPHMKWNQILRYIDPATGLPPKLTQAQLAEQNGIKEIVTQGDESFQALNIVLA